jgi:hypothetical protein
LFHFYLFAYASCRVHKIAAVALVMLSLAATGLAADKVLVLLVDIE